MKIKHQLLLEENDTNVNALPEEIRRMLLTFDELRYDLEELDEDDAGELAAIRSEMAALDKQIASDIADWLDDEEQDEAEPSERAEEHLAELYAKNPKVLHRTLAQAGIVKADQSRYAVKIGSYTVRKQKFDTHAYITRD